MRDPYRIPIIMRELQELWTRTPDWRLAQLVSNLKGVGRQSDIFHFDDDDLLEAIRYRKEHGWEQ